MSPRRILCMVVCLIGSANRAAGQTEHVLRVDPYATETPHDGTSWARGYLTLQDALDAVPADDDPPWDIWVASSIYRPDQGATHTANDSSEVFMLKNRVGVYGGFLGSSHPTLSTGETSRSQADPVNNVTILSGELDSTNSLVVVLATNVGPVGTVLEGVTVTGASENGCHCVAAGPTLRNIIFEYNGGAGSYGGGLSCDSASSPSVDACVFRSNQALFGGAIRLVDFDTTVILSDCLFESNSATDSGGAVICEGGARGEFRRCAFRCNSATGYGGGYFIRDGGTTSLLFQCCLIENTVDGGDVAGGGVYSSAGGEDGHLEMRHCVVSRNTAISSGSGALGAGVYHEGSSMLLLDCRITENLCLSPNGSGQGPHGSGVSSHGSGEAVNCVVDSNRMLGQNDEVQGQGGGFYIRKDFTLTNCQISRNTAILGGGIYSKNTDYIATNCTIGNNEASDSGGGVFIGDTTGAGVVFRNAILWGNTDGGTSIVDAQLTIDQGDHAVVYSCIQDENASDASIPFDGSAVGNIDDDPQWFDLSAEPPDMRLKGISPCIDASDTPPIPEDGHDADEDTDEVEKTPDIDRGYRVFDELSVTDTGIPWELPDETEAIADMGAYEFPRPGDIDSGGDGIVDGRDIQPFVDCFLAGPGIGDPACHGADLNGDLLIDQADVDCLVKSLISKATCWWLECPEGDCGQSQQMMMSGGGSQSGAESSFEGGVSGESSMSSTGGGEGYSGSGFSQAYLTLCLSGPDCNGNGRNDSWDLRYGARPRGGMDCNDNGALDECDVASGLSADANANGFPDECDAAVGITAEEIASADAEWAALTRADRMARRAALSEWINHQHWGPTAQTSGADQFQALIAAMRQQGLVPRRN